MIIVDNAFNQILSTSEPMELRIECETRTQQESIRMAAYAHKRKLPNILVDDINISRKTENGKHYVLIYRHPPMKLTMRNSKGEYVEITPKKSVNSVNPEDKRIIELMRKDGKTDEEIEEFLNQQ